jgi:hypothetical protein
LRTGASTPAAGATSTGDGRTAVPQRVEADARAQPERQRAAEPSSGAQANGSRTSPLRGAAHVAQPSGAPAALSTGWRGGLV